MNIDSTNLDQIYANLAQQSMQAGQIMNQAMQGDLTNPATLLAFQKATMAYQTVVGTESGMVKMVKDMLAGIISKI